MNENNTDMIYLQKSNQFHIYISKNNIFIEIYKNDDWIERREYNNEGNLIRKSLIDINYFKSKRNYENLI